MHVVTLYICSATSLGLQVKMSILQLVKPLEWLDEMYYPRIQTHQQMYQHCTKCNTRFQSQFPIWLDELIARNYAHGRYKWYPIRCDLHGNSHSSSFHNGRSILTTIYVKTFFHSQTLFLPEAFTQLHTTEDSHQLRPGHVVGDTSLMGPINVIISEMFRVPSTWITLTLWERINHKRPRLDFYSTIIQYMLDRMVARCCTLLAQTACTAWWLQQSKQYRLSNLKPMQACHHPPLIKFRIWCRPRIWRKTDDGY